MLYDDSGNNSVLVKIGTNDPYCFQQMNSKSLILIPVYKGQSVQEAFDDYCERTGYVCSEKKMKFRMMLRKIVERMGKIFIIIR